MTDSCYICGIMVPEGRMICPYCSGEITDSDDARKMLELAIEPFCEAKTDRKEDKK